MRSIIEISLESGMRLSEILRIDLDFIDGQTLKIPIAKTEPRIIPLTKRALLLIRNAELPFKISKWQVSNSFISYVLTMELKMQFFTIAVEMC